MGMDSVVVAAHDDDLFSRNFKQKIVTLVGDAADVVSELPLSGEQVVELFFEDFR